MAKPVVCFCTVVMNRLTHVKQTLGVNLRDNHADGIQFILLDYTSRDGLEEYIKDNFQSALDSERLVYYRYPSATVFNRSHSRNMAFRLAQGDIVANVDADNYAGPGFGVYVQSLFQDRTNVCLTGLGNPWTGEASGKLCTTKEDFLKVSGYDETFEGYGFEDYDIVNRLRFSGCEPFTITNPSFLRVETHKIGERIVNESLIREIENILVHFIDPHKSKLLYLLADGSFRTATVVNMFTINSDQPFKIVQDHSYPTIHFNIEGDWECGTWSLVDQELRLENGILSKTFHSRVSAGRRSFKGESHEYYQVTSALQLDAVIFYTQLHNRQIMMDNVARQRIRVNKVFGAGTVYKNFQNESIEL